MSSCVTLIVKEIAKTVPKITFVVYAEYVVAYINFTVLWANSAEDNLMIVFLFIPEHRM